MTHSELIAEVAKDAKLPRAVVAGVLRSFIKVIIPTLMSGASVRLRMFGTFYTVVQKKRPLFGGKKETKSRPVVRFKESRHGEVQRRARSGEDQDW